MYRLKLVVVGRLKSQHLRALADDYEKRLRRYAAFDVIELKDSTVEDEGSRLKAILDKEKGARLVVLSEEGQPQTSRSLAQDLKQLHGVPVVYVIGGPFGLDSQVKLRADSLLSLSAMTFTHEMARVLLTEQLYRAASINAGSKYHHD